MFWFLRDSLTFCIGHKESRVVSAGNQRMKAYVLTKRGLLPFKSTDNETNGLNKEEMYFKLWLLASTD